MPASWSGAALAARTRTVEAMALLILGGAAKRLVPMRRWSWILGEAHEVPVGWTGLPSGRDAAGPRGAIERQVAHAVRKACSRLPWEPACLAQTIAGQALLRRRGAAGVAVIGLRRDEGAAYWEAHAWLIGSALTITGGRAARGFTATTVFAVPGGLQPEDLSADAGGSGETTEGTAGGQAS